MALVSELVLLGFNPQQARHIGFDQANGLTATGNNSQAGGYAITATVNRFSVVTSTANSATLPLVTANALGAILVRNDDSADTLYLFPGVGDNINGLAANAAIQIPAGGGVLVMKASNTSWISIADTTALYNLLITTIQNSTTVWGGTSGGSANAQTITLTPAITAYVTGQTFIFRPGFANTGSTTLNINSLGTKTIKTIYGNALAIGQLATTQIAEVVYDGTDFIILNPSATWQTWSPTASDIGAGSWGSVSYTGCEYRYEPDGSVTFRGRALGTVTGVVTELRVSLPVNTAFAAGEQSFSISGYDSGTPVVVWGSIDSAADVIRVIRYDLGAFGTLANTGFFVHGNYRL